MLLIDKPLLTHKRMNEGLSVKAQKQTNTDQTLKKSLSHDYKGFCKIWWLQKISPDRLIMNADHTFLI